MVEISHVVCGLAILSRDNRMVGEGRQTVINALSKA